MARNALTAARSTLTTPRTTLASVQNLLLRSNEFDNALWTKTNCSILANQAFNPLDGTLTADAFVEDVNAGVLTNRIVSQNYASFKVGTRFAFSSYYKNIDPAVPCVLVTLNSGGSGPIFNLVNGTVNDGTIGRIEAVPGWPGWYKCTALLVMTAASFNIQTYSAVSFSIISHVGTGGAVFYMANAQLAQGNHTGAYVATTTTKVDNGATRSKVYTNQNLLVQSDSLNSASWSLLNATVAFNQVAHPITGLTTVDLISDAVGVGLSYRVQQVPSPALAARVHTFSSIVKVFGTQWMFLSVNGGTKAAWFDIINGVVGVISSGATSKIVAIPNQAGWYRVSITFTATPADSRVALYPTSGDGISTYNGDGTRKFYSCSRRIVAANWEGPECPTTTSIVNTGDIRSLVL